MLAMKNDCWTLIFPSNKEGKAVFLLDREGEVSTNEKNPQKPTVQHRPTKTNSPTRIIYIYYFF